MRKTLEVYTCPKCNAVLRHMVITTNPPIDVWECPKKVCGWKYEEKQKIVYVPFKVPEEEK